MAAYETGTASDVNDLLAKLRTFALANGWTQNFSGARTAGTGNAWQANKGGFYVTFLTDTGTAGSTADPAQYIGCYAHDTYSGGNGTENQANGSIKLFCNGMPGPFVAYHFISGTEKGAEYLSAIVEVTSGLFKHFGTGVFVKIGAVTTGQYVYACRWNHTSSTPTSSFNAVPFDDAEFSSNRAGPSTQVRADGNAITWRWMESSVNDSIAGRGARCGVRIDDGGLKNMMDSAASALTGRNVFFPCFYAPFKATDNYTPMGYPPGIRWCNMTTLQPNDVVTIGSDQWKIFPVVKKNGGVGQPNSGVYGYAYKIN